METRDVGWHQQGRGATFALWDGERWVMKLPGRQVADLLERGHTTLGGIRIDHPIHDPVPAGGDPRKPLDTSSKQAIWWALVLTIGTVWSIAAATLYPLIITLGIGALVHFLAWPTDSMKTQAAADRARRETQQSGLAQQQEATGTISCPRCGGTHFKARRTAGQRGRVATAAVLTGGVGGVLSARKNEQKVQCTTCGAFYDRIG